MATIFEKNGRIYVGFMVYDEKTGKNKQKKQSTGLEDTPANRKFVKNKIIPKIEKELKEGKINTPQKQVTIKQLAEEFLKLKSKECLRKYTIKDYKTKIENYIIPEFGNKIPISLTVNELEQWQLKLLNEYKLKVKTISNIKIPFVGILMLAVKKDLISYNLFDKVSKISAKKAKDESANFAKRLKQDIENGIEIEEITQRIEQNKTRRQKTPFTENELKILFKNSEGMLKNWVEIAFFTAMRPSEQIALTWSQINFEKRYITVIGAITGREVENERFLNKTQNSIRVIYLSNNALKAFKRQFKLTGNNKYKTVFLNQYGRPYQSVQSIRDKLFNDLLKKCNIKDKRLYDLRHSFASINLSKNRLPITLISKIMGHSNPAVTLKEYSEYVANSYNETLEMVNNAFLSFD